MTEGSSAFWGVLGFAIAAAVVLWMARRWGYFRPLSTEQWKPGLLLWHVIAVFFLYFFFNSKKTLQPLAHFLFTLFPQLSQFGLIMWVYLLASIGALAAVTLFWRCLPTGVREPIWRSPQSRQSYGDDLSLALASWCVGFPVVAFTGQFLGLIIQLIYQPSELPDQMAVDLVKVSLDSPPYFLITIFSITILAPLTEEILFRGFLQTFIRKHLGSKHAILVTSLCFALFHFAPQQGLSNITIIGSLFAFALFLGYIYERQASLLAPIALHAIFNAISIFNLYYFMGEVVRGIYRI
jgi:membrane protease YdiL (CAAX protease family)